MGSQVTPPSRNEKRIQSYWRAFRLRTYATIVLTQAVAVLGVLAVMKLTSIIAVDWTELAIFALIGSALFSIVTLVLLLILDRSFHKLLQSSMVSIADETPEEKLPRTGKYDILSNSYYEFLQSAYDSTIQQQSKPSDEEVLSSHVSTAVDNMQTGMVILDANGKIIFYNVTAPVHTDSAGTPTLDLVFPEDDDLEHWLKGKAHGKISAERQWTRVADKLPGENIRRIFDIAVSYHKNSEATTVITFFDRTNVYTPEEDDLDFISFAAHELRGPITVIRGYLDVLNDELQPVLQHDQAELMKRLIVTSNRLSSYVNNILNASRYDRRHFKLRLNEESLHNIYRTIEDDMQLRASTQHRVLVVDIPRSLPTVAADTNSIGEVIGNLVDNAVKYSNEGGLVHVAAHAIPGFVEVTVTDRGIGIPSNIMQNLFHKFFRSHRSRETVAGTGIGLYICKAIVSSHGGSITARSVENEGSTFSFTLPIYDTVAQKLKASDNSNVSLIEHGSGWIRNHSLYRE